MSDLPGEPRDSIPILLARAARKNRVAGGKAPAPPAPGRGRVPAAPVAYLRSRSGSAGTLLALLLVFCAVFADALASDLPIACKLHGHVILFANVTRPADLVALGRERVAREADWKISALVDHGPSSTEDVALAGPRRGHPFGTDVQGRDVFARVIHGTRTYLVFALAAVVVSLLLGGFFGAVAGLFGGPTDALVGRAIETVSAFPPLVLIIGIQAAVPHATAATLFFSIALTRWPEVARLVRAEVVQVSTRDYILAARALGASPFRVLRKHVAPNVRGQLVVLGAVGIPAIILIEASLDFLRITSPGAAASWGETMSEFRDAPGAWWLLAFPGLFLFLTVVALTLVGEARRDALDPRRPSA